MANPTNSFGFWATGIQTFFGDIFTVSFNDGIDQLLNIAINASGGAQFFGFTDTSLFSSVTISRPCDGTNGCDYWGLDNIAFNVAPVPLPAALPLLLSGLGALGFAGWRRRKAVAA